MFHNQQRASVFGGRKQKTDQIYIYMKFGKFILGVAEWSQFYINYKALKKIIKELQVVDDQRKERFFFRLERELEKVNFKIICEMDLILLAFSYYISYDIMISLILLACSYYSIIIII